MENRKDEENLRAIKAGQDKEQKERFLFDEQSHILHLTARILKRTITDSDEEYSTALLAVSEAIDSYNADKGDFWNYAALVTKSRLLDDIRSQSKLGKELTVAPDAFSGEIYDDEDDGSVSIRQQVQNKTAVYVDNTLKDEIEALSQELGAYGIDLFDLPAVAPKSEKTKRSCGRALKAFFDPPPLIDELKRTRTLQVGEIVKRSGESRKLIDRHRKYLIAAILVKAGDYSGIGSFISMGNN
ncbi:MAG: hypothetical protein IJV21_01335 [Lachnospiraceae bacterium]|nr:hypothetical protein [Lachnospiraceae bacterium]MBR1669383.1 hypothetical protein [Butyrivibrio sp.]